MNDFQVIIIVIGFLISIITFIIQKKIERREIIYNARREAYSKFLRAWYQTMNDEETNVDIPNVINQELMYARTMFSIYASNKAINSYNKLTKFMVENNYLKDDFDVQSYLKLLGDFMAQLRTDCGNKKLPYEKLLGLSYIRVTELDEYNIVSKW